MARIRTIKPEFPQSESMGRVSRDARLLFILLWTVADDAGRLRGNSRMLASLLFPYDDDAAGLISRWLEELSTEKCILLYAVNGNTYIQIEKWEQHQKVDKPSPSRLPEVSRTIAKPRENSLRTKDLVPRTKDQDMSGKPDHVGMVFEYWKATLNHPQAKLDDKRRKAIRKALDLGYEVDRLITAIDGCKATPFNMGSNDRGTVYDDISLILRDAEHIDRFIRHALAPPIPPPNPLQPRPNGNGHLEPRRQRETGVDYSKVPRSDPQLARDVLGGAIAGLKGGS